MRVVATNIGERKKVDWKGTILDTGIFKKPVSAIVLGHEDVVDDQVIDRKHHGGTNRALYVYSADHYPFWKMRFPNLDWDFGMFGENLSVEGLDEAQIHVGSRYRVGEAIIEATEPRDPCVKLGMRFNDAKIIKQFWKESKSGVYFKVLQTGSVKPGDVLMLLEEKKDNKTIAEVYEARK
jgi:MOSC domain-containing protein YiiM